MGPQAGLGVAPSTRASPALQAPWVWPPWLHFLSFISAAATRLCHPCSTPHSGGCPRGAPPPLQALGTWGRDWDTGEHENGAGTVILFPIGSPSRPSAPAPSGPGPAPSGPTGCPSGLGPWSPHCLFLLPGRLEATQPRLPGGCSSAVHGPVLPAVLPVLPTSAGKRHSTAQGQLPVPRPSRLLLLAPALAWGGGQGEGLVARSTTVGGTPPWLGLAPSAYSLLR